MSSDTNGQPGKVSNFKLKASYWYVSHKLQLKKLLIAFLILLGVGFYSYSIYQAIMILFVQEQNFRQDMANLSENLIDYPYFHEVNKPHDVQILKFDIVRSRDSHYDVVAYVKNPNSKWIASRVSFQLIVGGVVVAEKVGFIYPNEEKYFAIFDQEVSLQGSPILKIAKVDWRRYRQFEEFAEPRLKFDVSDIEFKPSIDSGIRGELPVSILNFKITNNSAYSYWQVGTYMVLSSSQRVVGANYISLDQFKSGESRDVEMRWYESLSSVNKIEVLPEVEILSDASYMPVE